jgi:hypothetical protein
VNKQPKKQCAAVEHGERCPLDVHAGQYCNKHYRRLQLNGTLEAHEKPHQSLHDRHFLRILQNLAHQDTKEPYLNQQQVC